MIDIKKTEEEQVSCKSAGSCKSGKGGKCVIAAIVAVLVALLIITGISVAISTAHIQREAKALNSNFSNLAIHASLGNKDGIRASNGLGVDLLVSFSFQVTKE